MHCFLQERNYIYTDCFRTLYVFKTETNVNVDKSNLLDLMTSLENTNNNKANTSDM